MKVKISYTVDIQDVPDLAEEILESIRQNLTESASKLKFNPDNLNKMFEDFQLVENKLDVSISQMQDIANIAAGWAKAVQQVPEQVEAEDGESALEEEV